MFEWKLYVLTCAMFASVFACVLPEELDEGLGDEHVIANSELYPPDEDVIPKDLDSESHTGRARDSSSRIRPYGLNIGDVDGNGMHEWIGLKKTGDGYWQHINIHLGSNANFYIDRMNGGGFSVYGGSSVWYPRYTFVGRFLNSMKDDVCIFSLIYTYGSGGGIKPEIRCYQYYWNGLYAFGNLHGETGGLMAAWMPGDVNSANEWYGFAIGDFDGDGYDDIMTYYRSTGSGIQVWRYDSATARFVINDRVNIGDLRQQNWPGPVNAFAGEVYSAGATDRRDDVVFYNRDSRYVRRFATIDDAGKAKFVSWMTSPFSLGPNDDVAVANSNGGTFDDFVAVDTTNGFVRFLRLTGTTSFFTPVPNVEQGNLPYPSGQQVRFLWAPTSNPRNDVFTVLADGWIGAYFPVNLSDGTKTYWWRGSYTGGYIYSRLGM
jgi:hypothetical protein